jgi:hypothetical protein
MHTNAGAKDVVAALVPGGDARLAHLSDRELLAKTRELVGRSNQVFATLLAHLAEVDARGLHRTRACASLYTYCIYELRLSEDAAARRAGAAKLVKRFPLLLGAIAQGELHLTGLLMLGPHLTQDNLVEVLGRAKFRTKKELARLIRELHPLPLVPDLVEPLGPEPCSLRKPTCEEYAASLAPAVRELPLGERPKDWANDANDANDGDEVSSPSAGSESGSAFEAPASSPVSGQSFLPALARVERSRPELPPITGPQQYQVQFSTTEEHVRLIERAKALLARSAPGKSLGELHLEAMRLLVASLEKQKFGVSERDSDSERETAMLPAKRPKGRHIPAAVRRAVYERDGARCTYVDERGERCQETQYLELHHRHPFGKRGAHTAANVTLHCRAHNALAAELDFGRAHMTQRQGTGQHASLASERRDAMRSRGEPD